MVSSCGRYVIVTNGEIYNYPDLRRQIDVVRRIEWRGTSDTEVLLEAVATFGVEPALAKVQGMFAFAIWDRHARVAYLARDRLGEKPLCYSTHAGNLSFASEVSALEQIADLCGELDTPALSLFFRLGYIPSPHAVYEGVKKLPPGHLLVWSQSKGATVAPYWRLDQVMLAGQCSSVLDPASAVDELDALLREVVASQMISDVPLGVFLSGGIDSSLVAAIMQAVARGPIKTFTLGFESPEFNEAEHAAAVARHLKTDHTEHYVTAGDAQAVVPMLGAMFDEPFADPSQIPSFMVSRMAREQVTVCLSGDGGDEMFCGYVRYPGVPRMWNAVSRWPFRRAASRALRAIPLSVLESAFRFLGPVAKQYASRGMLGPSLRKAAGWIGARTQAELYELTMTAWPNPEMLFTNSPQAPSDWRPQPPETTGSVEMMMWRDSVDYLPGDILCKVDRSAMANSLETRAPLLDVRIAEFAWRLPIEMKLRAREGKWLPRQVLDRYVPRALIDRPKLGFSVPLHDWLTTSLRPWAEDLLSTERIRRQGILNPEPITRLWRGYLAGDSSANHRVWTLLMFQAWMQARGR